MDDINFFAEVNFRNQNKKFGIKPDDRRRHLYVVGKTGMGKTTMISNMMIQDIRNGKGVAVVDPHGEFAEAMLDYVPEERINDVIYFNPADLDWPIALNTIENVPSSQRHLIASGLIGIFKKIWADSWGPRLEYVLRNTILALLECPGSNLLGIMRMFSDKEYRKSIIEQIQDPVIKAFWADEYSKYSSKFEVEAVAPIQNKVGQFLTNSLIRNIVGQSSSSINFRKIMDEKKILLINLSKGLIGEDSSQLIGAMMVTKLYQAAMSRVDMPEEEREDFYLYVDEFQNFATDSFAGILSEARKYRLNLIMAHQYIAQLDDKGSSKVRDAVFGNVGTMTVFRVGAEDAESFEKEFAPDFEAQDIVGLAKANIYLKLMIDGVSSRAFSAATLAPFPRPATSFKEEIIKLSREKYATSREKVEAAIAEWSGTKKDKIVPAGQLSKEGVTTGIREEKKEEVPLFDAECWACGEKLQLKFQPDGKRPTLCFDHLARMTKGVRLDFKFKPREIKQEAKQESSPKQTIKPQEKDSVRNVYKASHGVKPKNSNAGGSIFKLKNESESIPFASLGDALKPKEKERKVEKKEVDREALKKLLDKTVNIT